MAIEILGLRQFQRALRRVDTDLPKDLRRGLNDVAQSVVTEARSSVPTKSGKLAGSIRATSTQKQARISMGGARVPYAGFIEFGGRVGKKKSVHREFIKGGRYLYPAFDKHRARVMAEASLLIDRLAGRAGLDG